eukprot:NODE_57_length_28844_cov_0.352687.p22 type:complete len:133 gc:universal NODE_57_length_28844_cov_0.352687:4388-3990(-)
MNENDEILEMQQKILKSLAESGELAKSKAELRAKIYKILKNEKNLQASNTFTNSEMGKMGLAVIYEFLQHFDLAYTLQVFSTETNTLPEQFEDNQRKISSSKEPILYQLLRSSMHNESVIWTYIVRRRSKNK